MPDYWLDSDSLIRPKNEAYGFDIAPGFWMFLEQQAERRIIGSSLQVFDELREIEDELSAWADARKAEGFFVEPDDAVQASFREVADFVNARYPTANAADFLGKADPWLVAHAKAQGGVVVTFEDRRPQSSKPKIPDVCDHFEIRSATMWEVVRHLRIRLELR